MNRFFMRVRQFLCLHAKTSFVYYDAPKWNGEYGKEMCHKCGKTICRLHFT